MSERPKAVVPGRVYGRGTVVLLCLITAFQRHEDTWRYTKSQQHANTDKSTLACKHVQRQNGKGIIRG